MLVYDACEIKVVSGDNIIIEDVPLLLFGIYSPNIRFLEGMLARAALVRKLEEHGTILVNIIPDRRKTKLQDLCELFAGWDVNINHWMVQNGFAKAHIGR